MRKCGKLENRFTLVKVGHIGKVKHGYKYTLAGLYAATFGE